MKFSFRKLFSTLLPRDIQLATRTRNQLYSPGWLGKKNGKTLSCCWRERIRLNDLDASSSTLKPAEERRSMDIPAANFAFKTLPRGGLPEKRQYLKR
jgi:hypothetical protein